MIPKSKNPIIQGFKIGSSLAISVLLFLMLATIGLNHQHGFEEREINDVRLNTNWRRNLKPLRRRARR